jgi:hypothetical protein
MAQGKCDKTGDSFGRPLKVTTLPRMYGNYLMKIYQIAESIVWVWNNI